MKAFPYGECECRDGCQCSKAPPGPAAYEVVRDGRTFKACTRCIRSEDESRRVLVTRDDNVGVFMQYDAMGSIVLAADVEESQKG